MKQTEKYFGRGFDSRHLHQKHLCSKCINTLNKIVDAHDSAQNAFDGDELVIDWVKSKNFIARQSRSRQDWGDLVVEAKLKVIANDELYALAA